MVKTYNKLPSELLNIDDEYVAYCLNEAISQFIIFLENGKKPRFPLTKEEKRKRQKENSGLQFLIKNKK